MYTAANKLFIRTFDKLPTPVFIRKKRVGLLEVWFSNGYSTLIRDVFTILVPGGEILFRIFFGSPLRDEILRFINSVPHFNFMSSSRLINANTFAPLAPPH